MNFVNNLRKKYVLLGIAIVISLLFTSLFIVPTDSGSEAVSEMEEMTTEVETTTIVTTTTTTSVTTTIVTTTTSTTTETSTTTTTVTSTLPVTTLIVTEAPTQPEVITEPETVPETEPVVEEVVTVNEEPTEEPVVDERLGTALKVEQVATDSEPTVKTPYDYGLTEYEVGLLRKLVSSEYGADWVPVEEKAKIVASIMNRVYNSGSSISDVIATACEPYGFNRNRNYYMSDSIIAAVDYYFANKDTVFAGWTATSWYGNGRTNTFYC